MSRKILGISAFYHDSAAALVENGAIVAAAEEERFSRTKHDARFPYDAVRFCLQQRGCDLGDVERIVFYDLPGRKLQRLVATFLAFAPHGFAQFSAAATALAQALPPNKRQLMRALRRIDENGDVANKLFFVEHHLSHAASAFYPSPFDEAAILTVDGVGEWATTSAAIGRGNKIEIYKELRFPHSLGLLYSAFTAHAGFKVNSGEYKLMGLAPYGRPVYAKKILDHLIDLKPDGSFRLNMEYFGYCTGLHMTNERFHVLFGGAPRSPDGPITQREMDLAASIQSVLEDALCRIAAAIAAETGQRNLCLAGGVALNCVATAKLRGRGFFKEIWIQPAAGDSGGAIGAALLGYYQLAERPRDVCRPDAMGGAYLGPAFTQKEIEDRIALRGARYSVVQTPALIEACVDALCDGRAVGWFQGRMEFGPRALGSRSILADARSPSMRSVLNLKVKKRESFRPFAPAVLREDHAEWFDLDVDSPYMLLVSPVAAAHRADIPAVTHVDGSARVQTVCREVNPLFHSLLQAFKARTGCPVIVNTSFNVRGEPIVCTPEDAFSCFMGTDIDVLAIGDCFLAKEAQDRELAHSEAARFEPD